MVMIEELVNKYYTELNDTDLLIWKYISGHKKECSRLTIYELADLCNVSRTTILRFAKKLSLSGYSELKAVLKLDGGKEALSPSFSIEASFEGYYRVMDDMKKKDFRHINKLIYQAKHRYACATGIMQNDILNELRRMFNNSGDYIINIGNAGEIGYFLKNVEAGDLVFMISLSGENQDTIEFARKLRIRGVEVISITKLSDNTLATVCSENIYIRSSQLKLTSDEEDKFTSSVGFFIAIEVLYLKYQCYKEEQRRKEQIDKM